MAQKEVDGGYSGRPFDPLMISRLSTDLYLGVRASWDLGELYIRAAKSDRLFDSERIYPLGSSSSECSADQSPPAPSSLEQSQPWLPLPTSASPQPVPKLRAACPDPPSSSLAVGFRFKKTVTEDDKQRLINEMVGLKKNCVKEDGKPYILVSPCRGET